MFRNCYQGSSHGHTLDCEMEMTLTDQDQSCLAIIGKTYTVDKHTVYCLPDADMLKGPHQPKASSIASGSFPKQFFGKQRDLFKRHGTTIMIGWSIARLQTQPFVLLVV